MRVKRVRQKKKYRVKVWVNVCIRDTVDVQVQIKAPHGGLVILLTHRFK